MIRVLVRHCNLQNSKPRPDGFSKQKAFEMLLNTLDESCDLTVMFDGDPTHHFVAGYDVAVVHFDGGCDASSFRNTLDYAARQSGIWSPDDIIYFVEDDYVHRPGWPGVMHEAFEGGFADMISLYDHPDRYKAGAPPCVLGHTKSCHWRSAESTTNTFALRYQTLLHDMQVYEEFADPAACKVCVDHERFLRLINGGRRLSTSIPAFASHCETDYMAPVVDWSTEEHRRP